MGATKRKVIRQGHNTLTVTLPARWTKQHKLQGGDELEIFERDNLLSLYANKSAAKTSTTIDIRGLSIQMMWKHFAAAYRQGYDEVKVIFGTEEKNFENAYSYFTHHFPFARLGQELPKRSALDTVQDIVNRFIGWGIIDTSETSCTIRELSEDSRKEFDSSMRRIFFLLQQMFERTIENIEQNKLSDVSKYNEMHILDTNLDRFHDFCCRIINKVGHPQPSKKPLVLSTLYLMEIVGDELKHIAIHCARSNQKLQYSSEIAKLVSEQFRNYHQLFYNYDKKSVMQISDRDQKIYSEHFTMARKQGAQKEERAILSHLKQISKILMALTELRIEIEFCK